MGGAALDADEVKLKSAAESRVRLNSRKIIWDKIHIYIGGKINAHSIEICIMGAK